MLSKRIILYFTVILFGLMVFSPSAINDQVSEISQDTSKYEDVDNLSKEDVKAAQMLLPYISKYVDNDESVIPLVLAVIKAESNFQVEAKSHKGALGLMQLMPETALDEYRKSGMDASLLKIKKNLIRQPELNIALGVKYLKSLQERLEGIENPEKFRTLVIASYNAGIHRVKRAFNCKGFQCYKYKANRYSNTYFKRTIKSLPVETRNYLQNVEKYYEIYKKILADEKQKNVTI